MVWLAYAGMCAIWGTTWLVIKVGLQYLPPFTGVGLRFVLAGLFLYGLALVAGKLRPVREMPWNLILVLATLLFGLNYLLTYTAETRLDSGLVAVLFGTLPFFMFGFGQAIAHEKTTPRIWLGAAVAFIGVAIISLGGQVSASPLYALAAIGAAASSAIANLYAKRHSHHEPLVTLPPAMLGSGIVITLLGIATEHVNWAQAFVPRSLAALAYLAILGSGIAFFFNLYTLKHLPAWVVGLTSLIIPVIAVAVGVALGGEHFTAREALGSAAVIAGMWIALSQGQAAARVTPAESEA
jgi:drug/metabolite transporter (DMT)-like permease